MNCIIIDDDTFFTATLQGFIEKTPSLSLVGTFQDAIEPMAFLKDNEPDLIFLDVQMPAMSGLEFLNTVKTESQVILVSSNKDYALEAFDFEVLDFLHKPLKSYARFLRAVNKAQQRPASNIQPRDERLFVKEGSNYIHIDLEEIGYVQAFGDYIKIFCKDKTHLIYNTLKSFLRSLPKNEFCQVHRSYVVRLDKIDRIESNTIFVHEKTIIVSASYKAELFANLKIIGGPIRNIS